MKVTIFFVMFFAIFFLLTLLFRKKVLRFEEKTYSEKTPSVIAERVEWKRYYDKPNKKGYQVYEYEINEKVFHKTFHDQDRVVLGAVYGGSNAEGRKDPSRQHGRSRRHVLFLLRGKTCGYGSGCF